MDLKSFKCDWNVHHSDSFRTATLAQQGAIDKPSPNLNLGSSDINFDYKIFSQFLRIHSKFLLKTLIKKYCKYWIYNHLYWVYILFFNIHIKNFNKWENLKCL